MPYETKIPDLLIKPLPDQEFEGGKLFPLLRFDDHLLRRFGAMVKIDLKAGSRLQPVLRESADEIWIVLSGAMQGYWMDRRDNSPTAGTRETHRLTSQTLALLPFGVAFACRTDTEDCELLRVMTHAIDPAEEIAALAWEDLLED
jgi:hypothetical protein